MTATFHLQATFQDADWFTVREYDNEPKARRAFRDFCDPDLGGFTPARLLKDGVVVSQYTPEV